ncbi:MAG: hypothetical protein WBB17_07395 [Saprospiraceae bacterium]
MKINSILLIMLLVAGSMIELSAYKPSNSGNSKQVSQQAAPRGGSCSPATKQIDMEINNVRARLLNGGDIWWDKSKGRYIVPKVVPGSGIPEVSALYAGGVWVGGKDPSGATKFMASTYPTASSFDYTPGPLMPGTGETCAEDCVNWDQFFNVKGANISLHRKRFNEVKGSRPLEPSEIPEDVLLWPARGNKFFEANYKFTLPFLPQGLGKFYDANENNSYDPENGDYPVLSVEGCADPIYPDDMTFWVYNDAGSVHGLSKGDPIRMEVQVQAFAFQTGDEMNDMSFLRYKLINRAPADIRDCYFAIWTDPDLGCHTDDYIGCDPVRELMYVYNIDATDGSNGCNCTNSTNTYCTDIPILGIDYFRGPLDTAGNELGMSSFMYYNNSTPGNPPAATTDPDNVREFYNYITGNWKDGRPLTKGGIGYGGSEEVKYAFPDEPADGAGWSMCSATAGEGDRRTIQATGPIVLKPGALNELIVGVVWVPDQEYPCPALTDLFTADQLSQDLFNNCFKLKNGPDAPSMDFVELDREIIILLTNEKGSNNYLNSLYDYLESGIGFPPNVDSLYRFEGYRVFQMANADVTLNSQSINDPSKVREIFTVDLKNGIKKLYNWTSVDNPVSSTTFPKVWSPNVIVTGPDQGIRSSFSVKEDQFATGDRSLINQKKYYFITLAYGYNNYQSYDVGANFGQRTQYCPGRFNLGPNGDGKPYVVIPRPPVYEQLQAKYGDGVAITRLDGIGAGSNFLQMKDDMYDKILNKTYNGKIEYKEGAGPIQAKIVNPLKVKNGEYVLKFEDAIPTNTKLDLPINWTLYPKSNPTEITKSNVDLATFNEQIISKYGFSINIGQTLDAGVDLLGTNGVIGQGLTYEYKDASKPKWFLAQRDNSEVNFIPSGIGTENHTIDPKERYSNLGEGDFVKGTWYPYKLTSNAPFNPDGNTGSAITPALTLPQHDNIVDNLRLDSLNNVDIVFTSDKSKWTRCMVIETWNTSWGQNTDPKNGIPNFVMKKNPSVGKYDANGDGVADPDGDGTGMGWFPGYAIDVESGRRLNLFFGENSFFSVDGGFNSNCLKGLLSVGDDMMWNPTDQVAVRSDTCASGLLALVFGGHHYIYVTKSTYDSCKILRPLFTATAPTLAQRIRAMREITWCTMPVCFPNTSLDALGGGETGLIPNDLYVRLRVDNPYQYNRGSNDNLGHNLYELKIEGKEAGAIVTKSEFDKALEDVNVVPNPYYGFSSYETGQFSNIVKITNLPAKCEVNIYSVDGKFIKQYKRDEVAQKIVNPDRGTTERQITPSLEWDLTNFKGIPVSSGAYLIYIKESSTGAEKIIKWFGVARKFDPSGL